MTQTPVDAPLLALHRAVAELYIDVVRAAREDPHVGYEQAHRQPDRGRDPAETVHGAPAVSARGYAMASGRIVEGRTAALVGARR